MTIMIVGMVVMCLINPWCTSTPNPLQLMGFFGPTCHKQQCNLNIVLQSNKDNLLAFPACVISLEIFLFRFHQHGCSWLATFPFSNSWQFKSFRRWFTNFGKIVFHVHKHVVFLKIGSISHYVTGDKDVICGINLLKGPVGEGISLKLALVLQLVSSTNMSLMWIFSWLTKPQEPTRAIKSHFSNRSLSKYLLINLIVNSKSEPITTSLSKKTL